MTFYTSCDAPLSARIQISFTVLLPRRRRGVPHLLDIDLPSKNQTGLLGEEYEWLRRIVPNYYVFTDRLVGDFPPEAGRRRT